jgi:hypothetical protein
VSSGVIPVRPPSQVVRSIHDLHAAGAGDTTLKNLVDVLSTLLELSARLPVLAYEAERERHQGCADLFDAIASAERSHVDLLLAAVRRHEPRPPDPGSHAAPLPRRHPSKE